MFKMSALEEAITKHSPESLHLDYNSCYKFFSDEQWLHDWRKSYAHSLLKLQERKCLWCKNTLKDNFQIYTVIPSKVKYPKHNYSFILTCDDCNDDIKNDFKGKRTSLVSLVKFFSLRYKIDLDVLLTILYANIQNPHIHKQTENYSRLTSWIDQVYKEILEDEALENIKSPEYYKKQAERKNLFKHLSPLNSAKFSGRINYILKIQDFECIWCREKLQDTYDKKNDKRMSFEHIVPRNLCRSDAKENFALACSQCNNLRGNHNLYNFTLLMQAQGKKPNLEFIIKRLDAFQPKYNDLLQRGINNNRILAKRKIAARNYIIVQRSLLKSLV